MRSLEVAIIQCMFEKLKPKRSFESVGQELIQGLEDGSVRLGRASLQSEDTDREMERENIAKKSGFDWRIWKIIERK